jgi:uncharacterized protein with GYD domain
MTTVGFVLISCEHGFERVVMEKLSSQMEVKKINLLMGTYDMIVKLETDTPKKLRELVIWKIRKTDKVRSIVSLVVKEANNFLIN